jgi:hypothetical protein
VDGVPSRAAIQHRQPCGADLVAVPRFLAELASARGGVLTRRQLASAGVTEAQVRSAVAAKRWRGFGRGVIALQNAPLTHLQREWVAVLLPDKAAALAGLSAAAAAGLRGFEPDRVHILVAHDTQTGLPAWVKVHESRRFSPADMAPGSNPPRVRTPRAVIDAATWSKAPRRACAILCAAVQQRLVTAQQLETELRRAGRVRHVAMMREILGDIAGGGHTLAEIDLGTPARRAGLGPPRRQRLRRELGGKIRWLDAEFDLPEGTALAVEVDGAMHLQPDSWWDDAARENKVVIGGQPVLRFPSLVIRLDPARVTDQLRRMRLAHMP